MNEPPKQLFDEICKEYDYKKLVFKRKVNAGYLSHNFIVSNGRETSSLNNIVIKKKAGLKKCLQ